MLMTNGYNYLARINNIRVNSFVVTPIHTGKTSLKITVLLLIEGEKEIMKLYMNFIAIGTNKHTSVWRLTEHFIHIFFYFEYGIKYFINQSPQLVKIKWADRFKRITNELIKTLNNEKLVTDSNFL